MTRIQSRIAKNTHLVGFVLYLDDIDAALPFWSVLADKATPEQHGQGPKHVHIQIGEVYVELYPADSERRTNRLRFEVCCDNVEETRLALIAARGILRSDGSIMSPDGSTVIVLTPCS